MFGGIFFIQYDGKCILYGADDSISNHFQLTNLIMMEWFSTIFRACQAGSYKGGLPLDEPEMNLLVWKTHIYFQHLFADSMLGFWGELCGHVAEVSGCFVTVSLASWGCIARFWSRGIYVVNLQISR